jgi:hypothetical protein
MSCGGGHLGFPIGIKNSNLDTDRFWNKSNFEVVPHDQKFAISFFFSFWPGKQIFSYIVINMKPARP